MQQTIHIDGMTCGGCVNSVEKVLSELSGIKQTVVSLELKNAVVTFDDSQLSIEQIIEEIEDAGFDAWV